MAIEHFETIVIGAGEGGALARMLAQDGQKTALIEKQNLGSTCVNVGCTPTKVLAFAARVAYLAKRGAEYGVQTGAIEINWPTIVARKQKIVDDFRQEICDSLSQTPNIEMIFGVAHFSGSRQIEVLLNEGGTRLLQGDKIILAVGARLQVPPIDGLDNVPFLDEGQLLDLPELPEHLLILGGGYLGVEFGQMLRRFGSKVTIIEASAQLLGHEDEDIASELAKLLHEDGIEIYLNSEAKSVRKANDEIKLSLETPDGVKTVWGTHLLVAIGRKSNADALNLPATGVAVDGKGFVQVNDHLETTALGIYAMGDVKGGPLFTHIAYDDARILCANLSEGNSLNIKDRMVPYTVFTDPQLGRIGLTESEAREKNLQFRVACLPLSETARGVETGETCGFWKVLVECETNRILGGAFLSIEGGEMAAVLQVAMMGKLPYTALRDATLAHPTLAESFNNLFLALDRRAREAEEL